jgi:membrane fusion protein (multidrug efflux system)
MSDAPAAPKEPDVKKRRFPAWGLPALRVVVVAGIGFLAWYVAGHWNRWTGAARYESTDDAYMSGDVTPLSAKVSGYIEIVAVGDYQRVRKGDLIVQIEDSDYRAALEQAEAGLAAAQATLANLAKRQRDLVKTFSGTPQLLEQADDNQKRTTAQLQLNDAQLDQQKAQLASLDVQEKQLAAQVEAARAQVKLARNNLDYTRIVSPADGLVGQRQVRAGQFVNIGTQVIAVVPLPNIWVTANFKETQMTNVREGNPATVTVDAFPDLRLTGRVDSWSPGTGSTFALLPPDNATGNFTKVVQRVPVKIVLDPNPALGVLVRPGMSVEATVDTGGVAAPANPPVQPQTAGQAERSGK